jgi:gliding motility-associated protein GldM
MMRKNHPHATSRYKLLLLIPVTTLLISVTGCLNGYSQNEAADSKVVAPTKLNVLYVGLENPVNIPVPEYAADDITVSIDNGSITGKNGEYIAKPHQPGKAVISVAAKGKTIKQTEFTVKFLPPPVVALKPLAGSSGLIKGGSISKDELLKADGIRITIEDSEYKLPMTIASFDMVVRATDKSVAKSAGSTQDKYSAEQVNLIKSLDKGQQVFFENIVVTSLKGNRKTPMIMEFTISGK